MSHHRILESLTVQADILRNNITELEAKVQQGVPGAGEKLTDARRALREVEVELATKGTPSTHQGNQEVKRASR